MDYRSVGLAEEAKRNKPDVDTEKETGEMAGMTDIGKGLTVEALMNMGEAVKPILYYVAMEKWLHKEANLCVSSSKPFVMGSPEQIEEVRKLGRGIIRLVPLNGKGAGNEEIHSESVGG